MPKITMPRLTLKQSPADRAAKAREIMKFTHETANNSIRALFLSAGGSLIALMAYLGTRGGANQLPRTTWPFELGSALLFAALVASVAAWLMLWSHHHHYDHGHHGQAPITQWKIMIVVGLGLIALLIGGACFGMWLTGAVKGAV